MYNALTVHALVSVGRRVGSVLEIPKFWGSFAYIVGGQLFTLDDIEHGVLRGKNCTTAPLIMPLRISMPYADRE